MIRQHAEDVKGREKIFPVLRQKGEPEALASGFLGD
jgi:hypothetical protein